MELEDLRPQQRVYRWVDCGIYADIQPLTVIRVSPKTVLVETDSGSRFRTRAERIQGPWPYAKGEG